MPTPAGTKNRLSKATRGIATISMSLLLMILLCNAPNKKTIPTTLPGMGNERK